jgi:hypothetical protein
VQYPNKINAILANLGDTSYLNSVLYLLGNLNFFVEYFLTEKQEIFISDIRNHPLSFVLYRLLCHHFYPKEKKPQETYKPDALLSVLGNLNVVYNDGTKRRNPNELIFFILNNLHRELNKKNYNDINNNENPDTHNIQAVINCGMNNFKNSNDSIISNTLNWFQIKESMCNKCYKLMYNFNAFTIFELDILGCSKCQQKQIITIYDCLNYYRIQKNHILYCSNCKNYTQITYQTKILHSPEIFIFSLDRGQIDLNLLNIKVLFEEDLDMSLYVENQTTSPKHYKLIGIVSITKNYDYCSFCKSNYDNKWYFYKGDITSPLELKNVINAHKNVYTPCLLAYQSY